MAIQKVGVIGCGLMGSGIAQVSAAAGFPTIVREVSANALEKGMASIRKFLEGSVKKEKMTQADMEKLLANLKGTVEIKVSWPEAKMARRIVEKARHCIDEGRGRLSLAQTIEKRAAEARRTSPSGIP